MEAEGGVLGSNFGLTELRALRSSGTSSDFFSLDTTAGFILRFFFETGGESDTVAGFVFKTACFLFHGGVKTRPDIRCVQPYDDLQTYWRTVPRIQIFQKCSNSADQRSNFWFVFCVSSVYNCWMASHSLQKSDSYFIGWNRSYQALIEQDNIIARY